MALAIILTKLSTKVFCTEKLYNRFEENVTLTLIYALNERLDPR